MDDLQENLYETAEVGHDADQLTPLHHGVIRWVPSETLDISIRNSLPAKNDRPFIYVPIGYIHRQKKLSKNFMKPILDAMELTLPNMVVVTAETTGTAEEQLASYRVQNTPGHPIAKDWSQEHVKEVLGAKLSCLLEGIVESSVEVGAWLLPVTPRRRNGAAQQICNLFPTTANNVSLGLIGLGEDEEDHNFKKSLDKSKVPVGSPMKNISKLIYDVNLKDGAPCPALTHLVIFESPEEKNIFHDELLALVPDFMVAFGNITEDAMRDVFENAKSGSPVILLKHSGKNVDSLCRMFRHVNQHIAMEGDSKKLLIPPIENEPDDLVRLFLNTWPTGYNNKTVVLSDPLIMNSQSIQKRLLNAITSAFDLKSGGIDIRLAKRKVLDYAWSLHGICKQHSKQKKKSAEGLHLQLVFYTLLSIAASVLYEKIYGDVEHASSMTQIVIYVLTILLPLYITSLQQESLGGKSMTNWASFNVATYQIESEILKFRCQVGNYRVEEKTEIALQRPISIFAATLKDKLKSLSKGLHEDSMEIPSTFWDFDAKAHMPPKPEDNRASSLQLGLDDGISFDSQSINDTLPTEKTPILKDTEQVYDEEMPRVVDDDDSVDSALEIYVDDKFSPIKSQNYIDSRMQKIMHAKALKIQKMAWRQKNINFIIKMITIGSGATAALSLQWAVPIVLGVTAAFGAGQEFRGYTRRIELGNKMIVSLNELKLWWMGLSMYQRQLPHNKDHLILTSEKIIVTELETSFNTVSGSEPE